MTSAHRLPPDLQERFRRDGFAYLPGALDANTLRRFERLWLWYLDHPGPASARLFEDALVRAEDVSTARALPSREPGFFYQDIANPGGDAERRQLARLPAIRDIVGAVFARDGHLGEGWFVGDQVFLKEPHTPRTGWHQDLSDTDLAGMDTLAVWMSFDPVDAEHALELVRGSHLGPVYSSIYGKFRSQPIPDIERRRAEFDVVGFACEPGDVVLFHFGTLHGGGATGTLGRRSLALRFVGPDCRRRSTGAGEAGARDPRWLPVFG